MNDISVIERSRVRGANRPDFCRHESLADIFAASAAAHPARPAIIAPEGSLSYAELDALSSRQAAALQRQGLEPEMFCGLWMPRGRETLVAQIAIAKTGAAWVPFDADAPPERVAECLEDVGAFGIVAPSSWLPRLAPSIRALSVEAADGDVAARHPALNPDSPAYVIYTSGSTGKPKGIIVTQANICHFLRAAADIYRLGREDRMLQAGSIAFDLSMEEIWVPYLVGAALVVCPADVLADPDRLTGLVNGQQVTAMDVVPTLLALLDGDFPSVRLIIVGGEACPEAVVSRYAVAGRTLMNSYGPSETTVVVTATPLRPGAEVTIGLPLANSHCYVVDEAMQLVPRGVQGELLVGGPQVAQGYVGRPDLTAEKFIANSYDTDPVCPTLYRTGDAVVMLDDGDLSFRGRIDDQVKLRGFRIELGEIESRLAREAGVAQAAVVVHRQQGIDQLVGFVVLAAGATLDAAAIKQSLRAQLPIYMVPAIIEPVERLPRLAASGKIDRRALAALPLVQPQDEGDIAGATTETEHALLAIAEQLFIGQRVGMDADFFLDLGGHSLLAAQFISAARKNPALAHLTLADMYNGRTLRAISALVDAYSGPAVAAEPAEVERASDRRRFWCSIAQAAAMPLIVTMMSAPWLAIFISYALISPDSTPLLLDIGIVFCAYALINIVVALLTVAIKWAVLGRTRPGRYPLWGSYYFRLWLVQRLLMMVHLKWMQNTPILRGYLRLLGAKVGDHVLISDFDAGAVDLIDFGDHCVTGSKTVFANAHIEGAELIIGPIRIGRDVSIGSSCVIRGDTVIGEGAELEDLTSVGAGVIIPAWTRWSGSPPAKVADLDPAELPAPPVETWAGRTGRTLFYFLMLALVPAVSVLPIVPAFRLMEWIDTFVNPLLGISYFWYLPLLALSAAAAMIAFTMVLIVACRWVVLPRVRPGRYALTSGFYLRRWVISLLIECALDTLSSLFATLYMRFWYRAMGSKIGKGTEISTSFAGRYELIELGANNFIADDVVMGDDEMRRNWMQIDTIRTGDQVFIGNEAVVPQGYVIGSRSLIGVKSRPPAGGFVGEDETWFGSPPLRLPVRQRFLHDEHATYAPPRGMIIGRALFEAFNVCLPVALFITSVTIIIALMNPVFDWQHWRAATAICIAASMLISVVQLLVAVGYKWLLMGRYRPTTRPMWSWWALRTEATSVMYWGMAGKALLDALRGTIFLPLALRLFGVKTGKGIYMDSTDITEFDSVQIDDHAVVNNHACLQTHLYEDRLMKTGTIHVGEGAVIGAGSTVLYDTQIGEDAYLGPLTLVMKGEAIPPRSGFGGSPARPITRQNFAPAA